MRVCVWGGEGEGGSLYLTTSRCITVRSGYNCYQARYLIVSIFVVQITTIIGDAQNQSI